MAELEHPSQNSTEKPVMIDCSSLKRFSTCCQKSSCAPQRLCVLSKSAVVILVLTFFIGCFYSAGILSLSNYVRRFSSSFVSLVVSNSLSAVLIVFYPLAGFIADVYCGRYKMIVTSYVFLWICALLVTLATGLHLSAPAHHEYLVIIPTAVGVFFLLLALPGFRSNIIQFGFDQLLDVPSYYLGLFVHWCMWADSCSGLLVQVIVIFTYDNGIIKRGTPLNILQNVLLMLSLPICTILLITIFILHKSHLFLVTRVQFNPYKLILKVYTFALSHKRPIRAPSAFVYCDTRVPSRMDFAKERFGGPFVNSDVEDVKTFGRVLCMLLTLAPVFLLAVPVSYNMFTLLTLHSSSASFYNNETLTPEWVLLGSGNLSYIVEVICLPLYIWIVFSVFRNRVPKILVRLGFAIFLFIIAVVSMLALDLTGHLLLFAEGKPNVMCMFLQPISSRLTPFKHLNLHWAMLLLPNLLTGIAPKLVVATALEFISAQSPHSMKGVMVGTLFAIRGLSQLVATILFVPFSLDFWKHGQLGNHPPVVSCGFGYFSVTILLAIIGLVCFIVTARKYKYRVRDEEGFSQSQVEEVFDRRLRYQQEQRRFPLLGDLSSSCEETSLSPLVEHASQSHGCNIESRALPHNWYGSIN